MAGVFLIVLYHSIFYYRPIDTIKNRPDRIRSERRKENLSQYSGGKAISSRLPPYCLSESQDGKHDPKDPGSGGT